ncbi:hypothetical protein [Actinoplanes sp. NPDC051494]|uniref:hypothetical protein n=1 Tax=Actinoplanes sp. NPDC051494 TaxID=3363907 RepID=UPI0037B8DAB9
MRIAVVFDASAARAYAQHSIDVGEILAEITDAIDNGEDVRAALPAMSYLTALTADNAAHLRRLAGHPAVAVVGNRPEHAFPAGEIATSYGVPGDTAASLSLAQEYGTVLLTRHGAALRRSPHPEIADRPIDITGGE